MTNDGTMAEMATGTVKIVKAGGGTTRNILGDIQTIKLDGSDTNGLFTILENDNMPGIGIPLHIHDNEDEVFRILEGDMEFIVGGEVKYLTAGDTIFLPRKVPHAFKVVGEKNCKALVTVIPSGIEHMFAELAQLPAGPPDMGTVLGICERHGIRFLPQ